MADDLSPAPADDEPAHPTASSGSRSDAVAAVAAALGIEAVVLVSLAVLGVVEVVTSGAALGPTLSLVTMALLVMWLLTACARGLLAGHSWVRGPAATVQILALLVALSFAQGGLRLLPAVIAAVAGATLVGLLLPAVVTHTRRETLPFADED